MPRIKVRRRSDEKLKELVLLIASRCEGDATFGATKLNKLLFYADFLAYLNFGRSITGQEYFALQQGPAPKRLVPIIKKMQQDGELAIYETRFHGYTQKKTVALRKPDLTVFKPGEIDIVHRAIQDCWGRTGREMSDWSHRFLGWSLAREKETIPYSVALVGTREPTLDEIRRGLKLEKLALQYLARNAK